jgi:hypothetical protein
MMKSLIDISDRLSCPSRTVSLDGEDHTLSFLEPRDPLMMRRQQQDIHGSYKQRGVYKRQLLIGPGNWCEGYVGMGGG